MERVEGKKGGEEGGGKYIQFSSVPTSNSGPVKSRLLVILVGLASVSTLENVCTATTRLPNDDISRDIFP